MTNIAKILKDCPKGTELYCTLIGDCEFIKSEAAGILIKYSDLYIRLTPEGKYLDSGELVLFPSKENRDWNTFKYIKRFKKGDFLKDSNGNIFICKEGVLMPLTYIGDSFCVLFNNGDCAIGDWLWKDTVAYYATEEEKQKLIAAIDEKGYVWDAEKLELRKKEPYIRFFIKKEPKFKPFDKVLVRDADNTVWNLAQYAFKDENSTSYDHCVVGGIHWIYCIPYEGNEHLLGTTKNCE